MNSPYELDTVSMPNFKNEEIEDERDWETGLKIEISK